MPLAAGAKYSLLQQREKFNELAENFLYVVYFCLQILIALTFNILLVFTSYYVPTTNHKILLFTINLP